MSRSDDPVSPELRAYVFRREGYRCVVSLLVERGRIPDQGPCRDRFGKKPLTLAEWVGSLTFAHVRDRAGGRAGKRPPSKARRAVAACYGHHLAKPVVDSREVREAIEEYLEELEGPDVDEDRPNEVIRRVRARGVQSTPERKEGRRCRRW